LNGAAASAVELVRLGRDLPAFLRHPVPIDQLEDRVRKAIETRERRFLEVVRSLIYGNRASPYLRLLRVAGCEFGDVERLVRIEGLEGALRRLADHGVYVTHEELKQGMPAVRGSQTLHFRQAEFQNPTNRPHVPAFTGGSTGTPSRASRSLEQMAQRGLTIAITLQAHGVTNPRVGYWWPFPLALMVSMGHVGMPIAGWWYPVHPLPLEARLVARYASIVARLGGGHIPGPRRCDLDDPTPLARWLAEQVTDGRPMYFSAPASSSMRVAIAAASASIDLSGVTAISGGEPVIDARRKQVEASGMRLIAMHSSVDLSVASYGCATPVESDDVHVMLNEGAVIDRERDLPSGETVNALLFTAVSTAWSNVVLNLELGDEASLEQRACECLLGKLGMHTHLSNIRSFEKLTGEGVTFARSRLVEMLEQVFPTRFGGTVMDYQATEEETAPGVTSLVLRMSPSLGPIDEDAVRAMVLGHLASDGPVASYHARMWASAGTLIVRREAPVPTRDGRVLTFRPARAPASSG
jgi:hypothetical protein